MAWCALMALNQIFWLPHAREAERNKLAAEALQKTIELGRKPMWKSLLAMPLVCVAISSCQKTTSVNACSGW